MGWRCCVLVWLSATGCIRDDLVECGDGRLCPRGTVCDRVHASCVTEAQTTVCTTSSDGERCDAAGDLGICDMGYCVPGCGDSVHGAGEECDDGNARSHDGCSATCLTETPQWTRWQSPWSGRVAHGAAYQPTVGLVVFGGTDDAGVHADEWRIKSRDEWMLAGPLGPPPRRQFAMDYDSTRNVIVLFGGLDGTDQTLGDTWELDGSTWTQIFPPTSPGPRAGAKMAFDTERDVMIMFGGFPGETWEYNGTTWTKRQPADAPSPRVYHGMAWDALRNKVVVFGGIGAAGLFGDTWEYNGITWSLIGNAGPSPRFGSAMAYSPARQKMVLFGGVVFPQAVANDTWEYGAGGWTQATAGTSIPPARYFATLTLVDNADLMLVGGADDEGRPRPDVWRYDGVWTEDTPRLVPDPREGSMACDEQRGVMIMYGGTTIIARNDAWTFDGTYWRAAASSTLSTRSFHGLTYDSRRMRGVLFGGVDQVGAAQSSTLEWSGVGWGLVGTTGPSPRSRPALAFDPTSGVSVLFGGFRQETTYDDTWEYDGSTWTPITAPVHPAADAFTMLAYDAERRVLVAYGLAGVTWIYEDRTWRAYTPSPSPPPRAGGNLWFNGSRRRMQLFGGFAENYVYQSELWELMFDEAGEPTWHATQASGVQPEARFNAAAGYLPALDAVVLFGGASSSGPRGDTWLLTYD